MLTIKELENKTEKELLHEISELKGKLLALRFENTTGQLKEGHLIKETKKDIARMFTQLKAAKSTLDVKQQSNETPEVAPVKAATPKKATPAKPKAKKAAVKPAPKAEAAEVKQESTPEAAPVVADAVDTKSEDKGE